jgi:hypothetical protein
MLPPGTIEKVLSQAQNAATHSWEYGIVFEALLEYYNPSHSIFNDPFPNGQIPQLREDEAPALKYVKPFVLTDSDELCEGNGTYRYNSSPFKNHVISFPSSICSFLASPSSPMSSTARYPHHPHPTSLFSQPTQGSSADPVSLAIPALLLSHTTPSYLPAVHRQLTTLLTRTPRFPNTALSHRTLYPSLWADFLSMVPPFLAYFSIATASPTHLRLAIQQCQLYCEVLSTDDGCWRHICNLEEGEDRKKDEGLWSTGNGWVVHGLSRVVATMRKSDVCGEFVGEEKSLVNMVKSIFDNVMQLDTHPSGLLRNRLDDASSFGEVAGTALMAATVFRMAVLAPEVFGEKYVDWAIGKMGMVESCVDGETGVVGPVINPVRDEEKLVEGVSAEAQAFVVLLEAARMDWERSAGGENK